YRAAQWQHDLCGAARCGAAAQRAGDRAGAAARWRDHRSIRRCKRDAGDAEAARSQRRGGAGWRGRAAGGRPGPPGGAPAPLLRLDAFCRGVVEGLGSILKNGHPLVLAGDGDVGGLLGIHLHEEMKLANAVVSIDGLELKEFDYIDIGTMLETTGAVPVVIK